MKRTNPPIFQALEESYSNVLNSFLKPKWRDYLELAIAIRIHAGGSNYSDGHVLFKNVFLCDIAI